MNKVVHKVFLLWDWEKEAAWLNEMSRQGWQLRRVGWCRYEFEPGEPGRWQYQLEMLQKNDPDYLAFLEDTGIQVVGRLFRWVYLRRENDGTPFELFSDTDSILRHMDRVLTLCYLLGGINLFLGASAPYSLINLVLGAAICLGALPLALRRRRLARRRKMQECAITKSGRETKAAPREIPAGPFCCCIVSCRDAARRKCGR